MASLLAAPELWMGLGLFAAIAYAMLGRGEQRKHFEARLARVTRTKPVSVTSAASGNTLRRARVQQSALGEFLEHLSSMEKLAARLGMAGMVMRPQKFLGVVLGLMLGTWLLMGLSGQNILLAFLAGIIVGIGIPHFIVSRKIKKRKLRFLKLFPDAIELIVRGIRAGLPVGETFQSIAKEAEAPVGPCFATISQQIALGLPMERALSDMADRLAMTEFNFFVTTIIMQRETGGNLGEILSNLAEVLRQRNMMKLKIGALSSEARASAYIIGALPIVVFLLLKLIAPDYIDQLFTDATGNIALACAAGSVLVGGVIMKRMTSFEI